MVLFAGPGPGHERGPVGLADQLPEGRLALARCSADQSEGEGLVGGEVRGCAGDAAQRADASSAEQGTVDAVGFDVDVQRGDPAAVELDLAELDVAVAVPLDRSNATRRTRLRVLLFPAPPSSLATRYRIRSQPASISAEAHLISVGAESTIAFRASRHSGVISRPYCLL